MASALFNAGKKNILNHSIDMLNDTIKAALFTSSFVPDKDSHTVFSDISANESSGTGYASGGIALSSTTVTQDNTNDRAVFGAADISWSSSTIADARYVVLYKSTGTASTSPLIGYIDLLSTKSSNGDDFPIEWDADGIFYIA